MVHLFQDTHPSCALILNPRHKTTFLQSCRELKLRFTSSFFLHILSHFCLFINDEQNQKGVLGEATSGVQSVFLLTGMGDIYSLGRGTQLLTRGSVPVTRKFRKKC